MNFTIMPINGYFCKVCKKLVKELFHDVVQNEEVLICKKCLDNRHSSFIEDNLFNNKETYGFRDANQMRKKIIEKWKEEKKNELS